MESQSFFLFDLREMERIELFNNMLFGRDSSADVVVDDGMVSSNHFKVLIEDGEVYVMDLDSLNKTYVNNLELEPNKKIKLSARDIIRVGSYEFSYQSVSAKNIDLPDLTSNSLKVDRFGSKSDCSLKIVHREGSQITAVSLPKVEVLKPKKKKPEFDLKTLRNAKKELDQLGKSRKGILEQIDSLKLMRRKKIDVGAKMDQVKKIFEGVDIQSEDGFEKEIRIQRGTIEGLRMKIKQERAKIKEAEAIIAQAKFNISAHSSLVQQAEGKLKSVNQDFGIFKNKTNYENEFEDLKVKIKKLEDQNLESKKVEIEKNIRQKEKEYREIQSQYGTKINLNSKKKASSE